MAKKQLSNEELIEHLQLEVVRLSRLTEEWKTRALTDSMTGLPNRQAFLDRLTEALDHAKTSTKQINLQSESSTEEEKRNAELTTNIAIGFIDLDGFKLINDRYGHDAGDAALCTVGDFLQKSLRTSDSISLYQNPNLPPELAGRLGGDEFVVILPHTDSEKIQARKEKIEAGLNQLEITHKGKKIAIHGSMAVIDCDLSLSPEENLAIVDAAMYKRKQERKASLKTFGQVAAIASINGMPPENFTTFHQPPAASANGQFKLHLS